MTFEQYTPPVVTLETNGGQITLRGLNSDDLSGLVQRHGELIGLWFEGDIAPGETLEELTDSDPRNILNGGAAAGGSAAAAPNMKIINMIDSGSVVSEGLATQDGEKAIFNYIRANRTGIKSVLG